MHEWALRTGVQRIIVPSEVLSARRVRSILHTMFGNTVASCVPALDPIKYHADDWWHHEAGLVSFQKEILKYVDYRAKY